MSKRILIVEVPEGYEVYKVQLQGVKMSSKDMLAVYDFSEVIPPSDEEIKKEAMAQFKISFSQGKLQSERRLFELGATWLNSLLK